MSPLGVALPAAFALLVAALFPCLLATLRGEPVDRLSGLILAGPAATLVLLLLAAGYGRPAYLDAAFVVALLSFAGSLVFARFLGRTV
ncbi:MrpF/PhaF family protein [Actinomadura sp. DC4]|uniref:MrpF/PhaF family protein n=1 Tax=Actinomadura sp. DC4 TaxID=3055069 RepID=UPI0025B13289|nr:MrpF/PhaF family protein [Actinomadura sp. DC4]MDN3357964.1 MrpF/PhaF family protein [Actinomadura sp. DC4]